AFGASSVEVIESKRLHLKKGNLSIPQMWEAVPENKTVSLTFSIQTGKDAEKLQLKEVFNRLNDYAYDVNDREYQMLEEAKKSIPNKDYNSLNEFYADRNDELKSATETAAYLRLGSGKGYFFNSVGLAVYDYKNGAYF